MTITHLASHPIAMRSRRTSQVGAALATIGAAAVLSGSAIGQFIAIAVVFVLAIKWPVDRLIVAMIVLFTAVDDPASAPYNGLWESPVQHVGDFWFLTIQSSVPFLPIPVAPMLLVSLIVLARAAAGRVGPNLLLQRSAIRLPDAFGKTLLAALTVIPVMMLWGAATGGAVQQIYYQIFGILVALSLAGATARVSTPRLSETIWKVLLLIGIYRAFLAIYIFLTVARGLEEPPLYLTSHNDSILWALGLVWVFSGLIERADPASRWLAVTLAPVLGLAIIVNNRRLAWVVVAFAMAYVILSASRAAHKRLRAISGVAIPVLGVYFALGVVSPPGRVFAPVQALLSVVTGDDRSSQTRGIEDFNLVFSARQTFPIPTGFGKPYIEAVVADDISRFFPQFQYLPHNSILGMLMLVGPIGLALLFAPLSVCVLSSHRVRRAADNPSIRTQTAMVMTAWIAFLSQAWGDLGLFSPLPTALIGVSCGLGVGLYGWYDHHNTLASGLE